MDSGKYTKITSKSFKTLRVLMLMSLKFFFFICVTKIFKPFLELYQRAELLVPYLFVYLFYIWSAHISKATFGVFQNHKRRV